MTKAKTYPALSEAEFNEGAVSVNGIKLHDDEDGYWIFSYGHHEQSRFADATNTWLAELGVGEHANYEPRHVQHRWAVTVKPGPEWLINWALDNTSDTDGAFPVTVVYV